MLVSEMTLGRCWLLLAAWFNLFWVMLLGRPSRAVRIGSSSILRSQRGPEERYWMAAVKLLGRSKALTARSRLRKSPGNWPWSKMLGWEKLNRPEPSSMDLDRV